VNRPEQTLIGIQFTSYVDWSALVCPESQWC
jgi:hypothetical protein